MAVTKSSLKSDMSIEFKIGINKVTGKDIMKKITFHNVKTDAKPEDVHAVAQAFGTLIDFALQHINEVDTFILEETK